jgi:uncharacterized protein
MRPPTTMAGNGAALDAAAVLYRGSVMHARLKPVSHRFVYHVTSLLIDLDRLDEADRQARLFSVNRGNLVSFHERDHGLRDGSSLRAYADRLLAESGMERPERVQLLCYPRVLGHVFNPLSVYFASNANGDISGLIYEVRNTFGEMHSYVAPLRDGEMGAAGIRQARDKQFYVSPFMSMAQRYHFHVLPPGQTVRVLILETDRDGPTLSASFAGTQIALTGASVARIFAALPVQTLKVVGGIHYEALKLWLKGAPYFPHSAAPKPSSGAPPGPEEKLSSTHP